MLTKLEMEVVNNKKLDELTRTDNVALDQVRETQRLKERLQDQIDYCRQRLSEAERHLQHEEYDFQHSMGILANAAVELDTLAAQYSMAQKQSARLAQARGYEYREARPELGHCVVAIVKWLRVACLNLPALPKVIVFSYLDGTRARWAVAVGSRDEAIADHLSRQQALDCANREALARGGLGVSIES